MKISQTENLSNVFILPVVLYKCFLFQFSFSLPFYVFTQKQKGHILDDGDLIATLKQSKITSVEIVERLKLAEENERRISAARSRYLPVATRGAVLQFVLADLESLNAMYQFSLTWFIGMFQQCIGNSKSTTSISSCVLCTFFTNGLLMFHSSFFSINVSIFDRHCAISAIK